MPKRLLIPAAAAGLPAVAVAVYLGALTVRIHRQAGIDEARPADVIVVLGAAAYRGRPSPVFRARLDHAYELYRKGLAPRLLTTGGAGGDPDFTESETGRDYLIGRGVPSEAIILEPRGDSTVYSTTAAAEILRRMGLRSAIVVSDGYHIYRSKTLLEARGIAAYGSPRPVPAEVRDDWRYWRLCFRQAVGLLLWRVGIRR
ncbi:MAG TPA: YdcF family protein [Bryobacterales bacterium]|nr:YdcF family protein [Bryobacterales bacterium]